jgi:alcohol dehydrogenase (cytochrome c)
LIRISALFLTILIVLGSIGAANAAVNNSNKTSTTQSVVTTPDKNWTSINYDPNMSRGSPQKTINTTNVNQLVVKWKYNTTFRIEDPALIVGNATYIQNNIKQIYAINLLNGKLLWKYDPKVNLSNNGKGSHGILYQSGIIYAPTGQNGTVIALNASNGHLIWQSPLIDSQKYYYNPSPPIIWKNLLIVGSGGGDRPAYKGTLTALNKTTGKIIWQITTCTGPWVQGSNATVNGGGAVWSGGAFDTNKGIIYLPVGNPSPDYNASTRKGNTSYTNDMIAVNITNGHIIWATPFVQVGTVLNVKLPDTNDWDTYWGSQLVTVNMSKGVTQLVIGKDKHGDIMAMYASTGKPLWWINLQKLFSSTNTTQTIESCYASNDINTFYIQVSPFTTHNGTIVAIDLLTGKIKWKKIINATISSPLVSNGMLFASDNKNTVNSGFIMALNKLTGSLLWKFNVGSQVGQGGPSIGQGMLLVPLYNGILEAFGLKDPINQTSPIIKPNITNPITQPNTASPIIKPVQNNPVNPTNKSYWTNTTNYTQVNHEATIPIPKTGIPIIPALLALFIMGGSIIERKLRK